MGPIKKHLHPSMKSKVDHQLKPTKSSEKMKTSKRFLFCFFKFGPQL